MYRFMMAAGASITVVHALVAFTPLYDLVVIGLLRPPAEIVEPARLGLMIMLPWTWSIGHRRFHQGVLIRYGDAKAVSVGTFIRLMTNVVVMLLSVLMGLSGIVVASTGLSIGVVVEMVFIAWRARRVVRERIPVQVDQPLTWGGFTDFFYTPLALTSFLFLASQPLGSAALSRMPEALNSLAVWPVLMSFVFLFRGLGFAFNEVVVTVLKEKIATFSELSRFALSLSALLAGLLALVALTPFAPFYFDSVAGLSDTLATLAVSSVALTILWPAISVMRNLYQGVIVYNRQTRFVSESVVVSLAVTALLLGVGVMLGRFVGLYVGVVAFLAGNVVQVVWLYWRSQSARRALVGTLPAQLPRSAP